MEYVTTDVQRITNACSLPLLVDIDTGWGGALNRAPTILKAAVDEDFVIMARTDALAVEGLAAAIDRACASVEAGADMICPEVIPKLATYARFRKEVKVPIRQPSRVRRAPTVYTGRAA